MKPTQALHDLGQSLWIDDITRDMLDSGRLKKYIDDFTVTGLTSNPTIFDNAVSKSNSYDPEIKRLSKAGYMGEALFFELALQDLSRTADLFLPWQAYRASFQTQTGWQTVHLPFSEFTGYRTRTALDTGRLKRLGIVAIGRAFEADLCVAGVALYR